MVSGYKVCDNESSTLKEEKVSNIDLCILHNLTQGIFLIFCWQAVLACLIHNSLLRAAIFPIIPLFNVTVHWHDIPSYLKDLSTFSFAKEVKQYLLLKQCS